MFIGFKNRAADPTVNNHLISWWTNDKFVHSELFFESRGNVAISSRTEENGVTVKPFTDVVKNPALWEFYRIPVASEQPAFDFVLTQTAAQFNYGGLFVGTVLKRGDRRDGVWFCSELCFSTLMLYTDCPVPVRSPSGVTPGELRKMVINAGCQRMTF